MSELQQPEDDDLVAAEYVLGTLDAAERREAEARLAHDAAFAGQVNAWQERLLPLSEATPDAEPSTDLWPEIVRRLGFARPVSASEDGKVVELGRAVSRWKRATAAVSALAACLALLLAAGLFLDRRPGPTLVAVLDKSGDTPAYLLNANLTDHTVSVKPVAARPPAGRSYELWIIDPSLGAPKSLGVLDKPGAAHPLPPLTSDVLARAVFAVTDEPEGGSPTGAPSGQPIFSGHLVATSF